MDVDIVAEAIREAEAATIAPRFRALADDDVAFKGPDDPVTVADRACEAMLGASLRTIDDLAVVGEEAAAADPSLLAAANHDAWIVDPLDGTTNYVHGLRSFAVSIALYHQQTPLVGTVLDPVLDECYWASRGMGAKLNGDPIQASGCNEIDKSLFVFSFPRGMTRTNPEVVRFLNMLENVGSIRRLGSAALNLCYVACGRADGYWATSLAKWDVAAGWLIASEAGASVADFRGNQIDLEKPFFCAAATPDLLNQAIPLLNV